MESFQRNPCRLREIQIIGAFSEYINALDGACVVVNFGSCYTVDIWDRHEQTSLSFKHNKHMGHEHDIFKYGLVRHTWGCLHMIRWYCNKRSMKIMVCILETNNKNWPIA